MGDRPYFIRLACLPVLLLVVNLTLWEKIVKFIPITFKLGK